MEKQKKQDLELLFQFHPLVNEFYEDVRGNYWLSKETALAQGATFTIHKRNDFIKKNKNGTSND